MFDKTAETITPRRFSDKVRRYHAAIENAPPRLFDIYVSLYMNNYTQESLAAESGYTPEYVQKLNTRLLVFLQSQLEADEPPLVSRQAHATVPNDAFMGKMW